jgi:hypothetical protein
MLYTQERLFTVEDFPYCKQVNCLVIIEKPTSLSKCHKAICTKQQCLINIASHTKLSKHRPHPNNNRFAT